MNDERTGNDAGGTDATPESGIDEGTLYLVVREAVEDAILGVIGTLLLVGIGFVVVAIGLSVALETGTLAGVALGTSAVAFGVYVTAATLELIPTIGEWV